MNTSLKNRVIIEITDESEDEEHDDDDDDVIGEEQNTNAYQNDYDQHYGDGYDINDGTDNNDENDYDSQYDSDYDDFNEQKEDNFANKKINDEEKRDDSETKPDMNNDKSLNVTYDLGDHEKNSRVPRFELKIGSYFGDDAPLFGIKYEPTKLVHADIIKPMLEQGATSNLITTSYIVEEKPGGIWLSQGQYINKLKKSLTYGVMNQGGAIERNGVISIYLRHKSTTMKCNNNKKKQCYCFTCRGVPKEKRCPFIRRISWLPNSKQSKDMKITPLYHASLNPIKTPAIYDEKL